jgi:hypothetical protein
MRTIWATMWALIVVFAGFAPTAGYADNLTFRVKSMSESKVQIEFFSQDRRHSWPGGGEAYNLNDYDEHEFKLNCVNSEKICYGAWVTGNSNRYWGVGIKGNESCTGCCYTCRGSNQTEHIVLRSPVRR